MCPSWRTILEYVSREHKNPGFCLMSEQHKSSYSLPDSCYSLELENCPFSVLQRLVSNILYGYVYKPGCYSFSCQTVPSLLAGCPQDTWIWELNNESVIENGIIWLQRRTQSLIHYKRFVHCFPGRNEVKDDLSLHAAFWRFHY